MDDLGLSIKVARVKMGLNQTQLALILGLRSQPIISWWERNKYLPSESQLRKVNQFLNMTIRPTTIKVLFSALEDKKEKAKLLLTGILKKSKVKTKKGTPLARGKRPAACVSRSSSLTHTGRNKKNGKSNNKLRS